MQDTISRHYNALANKYDEHLLYSPAFVRTLTQKMRAHLDLQPDDRLVDLGCGTAMYSLDLARQVELRHPILGVDPFQSMLEQIPDDAPVDRLCADALEFSTQPREYDKVLIKETVHHVDDRVGLFANLHSRLSSGGRLLLVHVPPRLDYPLFDAALERCLHWHADPDELVDQLWATDYQVYRDQVDFHHELPKQKYFEMVRDCYMSVLTSFSPDEIDAGLAEMEARYADVDTLEFVDHFDYVLGIRP